MKKRIPVLLALMLAVMMVFAGCNSAPASSTAPAATESLAPATTAAATTAAATPSPTIEPTATPVEPVTLTFFGRPGTVNFPSGPQDDPVAKEITRVTGVTVDWDGNPTAEKLAAYLASGDLPDVMMVTKTEVKQMVEGNLIVDLEPLLQTNGPDIFKGFPDNIEFAKKYLSDETGKLYFMPSGRTPEGIPSWGGTSLYLNWQYYKELNYPKIANNDDVVNVVKQMLKKHPTNAAGEKNYGISMWFDWGVWTYGLFNGDYMGIANQGVIEIPIDTLQAYPRYTTPDSAFWKDVELYFKANQAGILDPESLTQKYDNAVAKATADRMLSCFVGWPLIYDPGPNPGLAKKGLAEGYIQIPLEGQTKANLASGGKYPGTSNLFCVSAKCKTPDRAMDFINYMFSDQGIRTIHSGVQGQTWDMVDGKPQMKQDALDKRKADPNYATSMGITKYSNYAGAWTDAKALDGTWLCLMNDPTVLALNNTPLDKDYIAHYDSSLNYPNEYFVKNLKYKYLDSAFGALQTDMNDDQKLLNTQIESYIMTNCARCITAKNQAEFDAIKAEIIAKLKDMGIGALEQWKLDDFNRIKKDIGK